MRIPVERLRGTRIRNISFKDMSLKRSIFVLSICCVAVSLVFVALVIYICKDIQNHYVGTVMEMEEGPVGYGLVEREGPIRYEFTLKQQRIPWVLDVIWMLACILFPVTGLGIAGLLFYRIKLKTPIAVLKEGMECILLHLLSGLDHPTSGSLTYDGRDIYSFHDKELSAFRR